MISKLAKAHESWIFKIISAAVAVSFISLFGVTGYINSASQNQTVIKVGGKKIPQSEFSYRVQKEQSALKNLAGDDFEITEEMRNSLAEGVVKQLVDESVLDQTMEKEGIYFPRAFIQQIIFNQPEFKNPANGQFNPEIFKRALSTAGMTEDEYVAMVKRTMGRKMLVADLVRGIDVPAVLSRAVHKMDNQRKLFKYVTVSPADMKIERKISDDEIKQYFEDFGERFTVPEMRDAEVLYIPNEVILNKLAASDEMIEDYFKQHQKELDQPEKRDVRQMVFTDKAVAEKALAEVQGGKDFIAVAAELKAENSAEPALGIVTQDELADDLAYAVFEMPVNKPELLPVADTWQVVSVNEIIPAKTAEFADTKAQIAEILKNENLYEAMREAKAQIDDAVNSGKSLAEIGKEFGVAPVKVANIGEETLVVAMPETVKGLGKTLDFNEMAFSYGLNEISSAEEFDDGIAAIRITAIRDAHLPDISEVRDEITALWTVQEKDALSKETAENIANDAEDGTQLANAAKARNLTVYRSEPISRNETFANLTPSEINDLFVAETNTVKVFEHPGNSFVVVTPFETVNYQDDMDQEALAAVKSRARTSLLRDMNQSALNSYAEDFKIKIDYKLAGFGE